MLIVGKSISRIDRLKKQLSESFAMKDMGAAKHILGIRIIRDRQAKKLWLSQEHYVKRVFIVLPSHRQSDFSHHPGGSGNSALDFGMHLATLI
ncbi:hypothetical protein CR513_61581, partial [Mucuna pruriens]